MLSDVFTCLSLSQVKVLFVRNLANSVTEDILEKTFSQFGRLQRVKKLKDYAFVHFDDRESAVKVGGVRAGVGDGAAVQFSSGY